MFLRYPQIKRFIQRSSFLFLALLLTSFGQQALAKGHLPPAMQQHTPPATITGATAVTGAIIVNTATLSPTSAGDPFDGYCDLREAFQAAVTANDNNQPTDFNECHADPGPTFITFAANVAGQTITLAHGDDILPFVDHEITITGPITLSGGGLPPSNPPPNNENWDSRIFRVASGGTLTLIEMTLRDTFTVGSGGVILGDNNSTINLLAVSMMDNTVYSDGGAINTSGNLNILLSNFSNNVALGRNANDYSNNLGTGFGGAIFVSGPYNLTVSLSNFSGNTANKSGGAIAMYQSITADISDSNFAGNIAQADTDGVAGGGALYNYNSQVSITRVPFNGNVTTNGSGGAIFNNLGAAGLTISDSSFNANVSGDYDTDGRGGAIYTEEDTTITRTTFNANVVLGNGLGGAITNNRTAVLRLSNSTFLANAVVDGLNAAGQGGAIANIDNPYPVSSDSTVELRNVTITENKAQTGGAIYNEELVQLWNTIIDEGTIGSGGTCSGTAPQDMGHNLQNPGTACGAAMTSTDPDLEMPKFNGGAIATLVSLLPHDGSPAIDAGDDAVCNGPWVNHEDQRGKTRPKDGDGDFSDACDIGATEAGTAAPGFGSDPVQPGPIHFGNATPTDAVTYLLEIIETGNRELSVGGAITGPDAADFTINSIQPIILPNGAPNYPLELECHPVNATPGTRTATLTLITNDPDHLQVDYDLTCTVPPAPTAGFGSTPETPGPLDFGSVTVGNTTSLLLELRETGNADLSLGSYEIIGNHPTDFALGSLTTLIADGAAAAQLQIDCTPSATGLRTAQLTLATNDPTHPAVAYDLVCAGTAVQPPTLTTPGQYLLTGLSAGAVGPYDVVVSADGRFIYATDYGDDLVVAFERNHLGGLELLAVYENNIGGISSMDAPVFLALSPDGRNLYVAAVTSNAVVAFSRDVNSGELTFLSTVAEGNGYGCFPPPCDGTINGLEGAYGVAVSPDGQYVYISSINDDALVVLRRNTNSGELRSLLTGANFVQSYTSADLNGARGLTISPDGLHLYIASNTADTLTAFSRNPTDGTVSLVQTWQDGDLIGINPPRFLDGLDGATDVVVSPDGLHVYASGQVDNAVTAFSRNALTGQIWYLTSYDDDTGSGPGLGGAFGLSFAPDGRTLYAAGFSDDDVVLFDRAEDTGRLTHLQTAQQPELDGAVAVTSAPDGTAVYAVGWYANHIVNLRQSNPAPQIDTLLPASAAEGSSDFTLVIRGLNFLPDSLVRWNGVNRDVTYISPTELQIEVTTADLPTDPAVTSASVQVFNITPGGGTAVTDFVITHGNDLPIPAIDYITPQSLPAGASSATLSIYGSNFLPTSQVIWNGVGRATTYISSSQLQITLLAADLLNPGAAAISVINQSAYNAATGETGINTPTGGSTSANSVPFGVAAPGQNPAPTLTHLLPVLTIARGAASHSLTLLVSGQNFVDGATAWWNNNSRPTVVLSDTLIRVTLTAADVAFAGSGGLSVENPAPGGGPSNTMTLTIFPYGIYLPMVIR